MKTQLRDMHLTSENAVSMVGEWLFLVGSPL
jgi:hypothetical protein